MKKRLDLSKIITPNEVYKIARETGFVQRAGGKINPFDFLMTLVFRLSTSIPSALELIISLLNIDISRSGIHQRFTEKTTLFLKCCLQVIMVKRIFEYQAISTELFQPFNRVIISDSSSWDISPQLKDIFPGSGGSASEANCKIQFCYDYKSGSVILLEEMKGTIPDQEYSKNIELIIEEGDLSVTDLGYWLFETFYKIDRKGGFFVNRFNNQVNIWQVVNGEHVKLKLEDILHKQRGNSVEIEVIIRGSKKEEYLKVRLIAFRIPEETANMRRKRLYEQAKKKGYTPRKKSLRLCDWSIFVTNASEELLPGEMIRSIYRIRWCIELIFKSWKSTLRIHQSNVRNNHYRLRCELYAKFILIVIVHTVHQHLQSYVWNKKRKEISFDMIWKFIISRAQALHEAIRRSMEVFSNMINSLFNLMIKTCEKHHQPSRKTTLQMIDEMIGDPIPVKLSIKDLRELGGFYA